MDRSTVWNLIRLILSTILVFEFSLQVVSLVAWWRLQDPTEDATVPHSRVVLCVGDSHTYGTGASSRSSSYPSVLQEILNRQTSPGDSQWRVINAGWPGATSGATLQRLSGRLKEHDPDYVCLLVGFNNSWSDRDMNEKLPGLTLENVEVMDGWRFEWRTARLLGALRSLIRDPSTSLAVADQESAPELVSRSGPARYAESALPRRHPVIRGLVKAAELWEGSRVEESQATLRDLIPQVHQSGDAIATDGLVRLFLMQGFAAEAMKEAHRGLARFPDSAHLRSSMAICVARSVSAAEAIPWAKEAVSLDPDHPRFHRDLAQVYRRHKDIDAAFRETTKALALEEDWEGAEDSFRKHLAQGTVGPEALAAILAEHGERRDFQARLSDLFDRLMTLSNQEEVLRTHLVHMVALVRLSGAIPLVMTYARPTQAMSRPARRAAQQSEGALIDLAAMFRELLRDREPRDFFQPDGHPNDRTYSLMAEQVAATILRLN